MPGFLQIVHPDGSTALHALGEERITLGRGPAEIVVDAPELLAEHLLIAPRREACWVAVAQGAAVVPTVEGAPLEDGDLPWGTDVDVGPFRLRLLAKRPAPSGRGRLRPAFLLAALVVPAAALVVSMRSPEASAVEQSGAHPSPLFDESAACGAAPGQELHRAGEAWHAARAGAERYPYDAQDGVEAVGAFREAAACFRARGLTPQANDSSGRADALALRIEEDYRTRRLALARHLSAGRLEAALADARALRSLTRHRSDDYTRWLAELDRRIVLELDQLVEAQ